MAFLPKRFATLTTKNPLLHQRLIHTLFALTLTSQIASHKSLPAYLWSKEIFEVPVEFSHIVRYPEHMVLRTPRVSCDETTVYIAQSVGHIKHIELTGITHVPPKPFEFIAENQPGTITRLMESQYNIIPPKPQLPPLPFEEESELIQVRMKSTPIEQPPIRTSRVIIRRPCAADLVSLIERIESVVAEVKPKAVGIMIDPPKPEEEGEEEILLKPWHTYNVTSLDNQLRVWLMKIAPGGPISQEELPFRCALLKTLLSNEFQPFVNQWWMDEDEDDDDEKEQKREIRRKFFYAYMENVEWERTQFKRLFIVPGSKDFHQVDEDAFDYAYEFPDSIGVNVYRCSDIDCQEDLI
jgi:hypothetical protein